TDGWISWFWPPIRGRPSRTRRKVTIMADEPKAPAKPAEAPKARKPFPLKLALMAGGGLVAVAGAAAALLFLVVMPRLDSASRAAAKRRAVQEGGMGPVFLVKDLVINSADEELHYVKLGLAMEVENPKQLEELSQRDPQIRDLLISEFTRHTVTELNSRDGR